MGGGKSEISLLEYLLYLTIDGYMALFFLQTKYQVFPASINEFSRLKKMLKKYVVICRNSLIYCTVSIA